MALSVTQQLLTSHLLTGRLVPGEEIGIRIDQTLTQDATGTMVMLELEAMGLDRAKTEWSVQYVDHNLVQEDYKNPEDHLFLFSACQRFGIAYSRPGNGVSHPVHMERFGIPGKTLLGSDSHTCAAGSLGMLAIGAGGLEVALAIAGEPFYLKMPQIMGIHLTGRLPPWVGAKDVILELLRRHTVSGGVGKILEYYGPGLKELSAMDRHVIANMGAELGATTSVFPSDRHVEKFLKGQKRGSQWVRIEAQRGCQYDLHEEVDLSTLEPLIALPSSPDRVVPVREVEGLPIYQVMVGSSANPGYCDFAMVAEILKGKQVHPRISLDINPTSRQILENLARHGVLAQLIHSGARIHQAGCNGCIGMGQAPAIGRPSLRTVPRNFPGRSGTQEDAVYLCGPQVAAISALHGEIRDPRSLGQEAPRIREPRHQVILTDAILPPNMPVAGKRIPLDKGKNIQPLPLFGPLPSSLQGPVLIEVGDDISTDEIMPAGAKVLPFRSNIPAISQFVFGQLDEEYPVRTRPFVSSGHFILAGTNYGQGSSREHAALAPRYLGVRAVLARSFARIHRSNLINYGILPLLLPNQEHAIARDSTLHLPSVREDLLHRSVVTVVLVDQNEIYECAHHLTSREIESLLAGGLIECYVQQANPGSPYAHH